MRLGEIPIPKRSPDMSEETLQNDAPIESNQEVVENPIQGSELAPEQGTTESQEAPVQSDEETQKAKNQAAWNKQYGVQKQLERDLEAERARTAAFEAQRLEAERLSVSSIPDMPEDSFDDNYADDMANWQAAVQRKATFDANQNILAQAQQAQQQQAQLKQQQQQAERNVKFLTNAKTSNISNDEMQGLFQTIASYGGVGNDNAAFIMDDPDAALIVKHLAANPQEIAAMQQMNGYTLANHINVNVRAKAKALKPKQSSAPQPATNIQGGGADQSQGKHALIKGFSIE